MIWTSRLSPSQKYLATTGVTTRDFQLESPNFPDQFYKAGNFLIKVQGFIALMLFTCP